MMRTKVIGYADRARHYDLEYTETADHAFVRSLVGGDVRSVLEIPCGVGRNTLEIARPGLHLVAVDLEPGMMARLSERLEEKGLRDWVTLRVGDMRTFSFPERFDVCIVQREAFQLLIDRNDALRALRTLRQHLAPGGLLCIDLASFAVGLSDDDHLQPAYFDPKLPDGIEVSEWTLDLEDGSKIARSRIQHHRQDGVVVNYHYAVRYADGTQETWAMEMPLATYTMEGFLALATVAGLKPRHIYQDYRGTPATPDASRLIFLLEAESDLKHSQPIVGWLKEYSGPSTEGQEVLSPERLRNIAPRPKELAYFRQYFAQYYHEAFIPGQGTETILSTLSQFGLPGRWLDLGAGTTTLFWSIPLHGITEVVCCDVVVEALLILDAAVRARITPGCYQDALRMFSRNAEHLDAIRPIFNAYWVFDTFRPWPPAVAGQRFDLITAFGNFGIAGDVHVYRDSMQRVFKHLRPGGRFIGADWMRRSAYIKADGHDNSFLSCDLVTDTARASSMQIRSLQQVAIHGDAQYDGLIVWALERPLP